MAKFPIREAEVKALTQNIITGPTENPAMFPAPPVSVADLQAKLDSLITLCDEAVAAKAASEQVAATKNAGRGELEDAMKSVLRYAEEGSAFPRSILRRHSCPSGSAEQIPCR